jgi:hypothetical protein
MVFSIGDKINTVFGNGIITNYRTNDATYIVILDNWKLANDKSPTLYLQQSSLTKIEEKKEIEIKKSFAIGDKINTVYGKGIITNYRTNDATYIVILDNWKLANDKSPTLYLQQSSLTKFEEKKEEVSYYNTCVENAINLKSEAGKLFKNTNFEEAKMKYLEALRSIQVIYIFNICMIIF